MKSKIRDQTGNKRKQNNHQKNPSVNQFLFPFPQTRTDPVTCDKKILPSNLKQKFRSLFNQTCCIKVINNQMGHMEKNIMEKVSYSMLKYTVIKMEI